MRLKKIIKQLEGKFPLELAEEWDNVGLLLDSTRREIKSIMLCLDITRDVVDKAVANKVDLIISHHPFIFYPLKKITTDEVNGEKILKLARNNIAVYSMHTNIDSGIGGLNDFIIKKIGQEGKVFAISDNRSIELRKLVTSDLIDEKDKIINPLRIQKLKSAITIEELCKIIKEKLCIPNVRVVGDTAKLVKSYAICTGSGMSFSGNVKKKADVSTYKEILSSNAYFSIKQYLFYRMASVPFEKKKELIELGIKQNIQCIEGMQLTGTSAL